MNLFNAVSHQLRASIISIPHAKKLGIEQGEQSKLESRNQKGKEFLNSRDNIYLDIFYLQSGRYLQ